MILESTRMIMSIESEIEVRKIKHRILHGTPTGYKTVKNL